MSNLLEMFNIISDPVKIAWVLWAGWGIAQIGWYRRTRQQAELARAVGAHAAPQMPRHSSGVRRTAALPPLPVSTMEKQPWDQNNS